MKVEKQKVIKRFQLYVENYDATDPKTALKIHHTYRVAGLCEQIARSEGMSEEECALAWLTGMLHDIGRFEQLRRYNTFIDASSVDHAKLGADILFGGAGETACIREFVTDDAKDALIETAIRVHSLYRVPEEVDAETAKYCHILRDADKVDILRVNVETPLEDIYNTTAEELYGSEITGAVMDSFFEHHATLRSIKRTTLDHVAGHLSLIFELVFPESLRLVKQQGYWEKLLAIPTRNPKAAEQLQLLKAELQNYLDI